MKEYQARGGKFPPLQKDEKGNYILEGYYKDEKGNWIRRNSPASSMATQDNERTLEALTVVEDKKGKGKELSTIDSPTSSVSTQVIENTFEALTVVEDKKGKGKELSATDSPSSSMVTQNGKHIPKAMVVKDKKDVGKKVANHDSQLPASLSKTPNAVSKPRLLKRRMERQRTSPISTNLPPASPNQRTIHPATASAIPPRRRKEQRTSSTLSSLRV